MTLKPDSVSWVRSQDACTVIVMVSLSDIDGTLVRVPLNLWTVIVMVPLVRVPLNLWTVIVMVPLWYH